MKADPNISNWRLIIFDFNDCYLSIKHVSTSRDKCWKLLLCMVLRRIKSLLYCCWNTKKVFILIFDEILQKRQQIKVNADPATRIDQGISKGDQRCQPILFMRTIDIMSMLTQFFSSEKHCFYQIISTKNYSSNFWVWSTNNNRSWFTLYKVNQFLGRNSKKSGLLCSIVTVRK